MAKKWFKKLLFCGILCISSVILFQSFDYRIVSATEEDTETITSVQNALNNAGYDCGTSDGVFGSNTQSAIQQYQEDHEMEISGTIDNELLISLGINADSGSNDSDGDITVSIQEDEDGNGINEITDDEWSLSLGLDIDSGLTNSDVGIPVGTFVERFNDALNAYNVLLEQEDYDSATGLTIYDVTSSDFFSPNDRFTFVFNNNIGNKGEIGIVSAYILRPELLNDVATGELIALCYAIDTSIIDLEEATTYTNELLDTKEFRHNNVTFTLNEDNGFWVTATVDDYEPSHEELYSDFYEEDWRPIGEEDILSIYLFDRRSYGDYVEVTYLVKNTSDSVVNNVEFEIYFDTVDNMRGIGKPYNDCPLGPGEQMLATAEHSLQHNDEAYITNINVASYTYRIDNKEYTIDLKNREITSSNFKNQSNVDFNKVNIMDFNVSVRENVEGNVPGIVDVQMTNTSNIPVIYVWVWASFFDNTGINLCRRGASTNEMINYGNYGESKFYYSFDSVVPEFSEVVPYYYEYELQEPDENGFTYYKINLFTKEAIGSMGKD